MASIQIVDFFILLYSVPVFNTTKNGYFGLTFYEGVKNERSGVRVQDRFCGCIYIGIGRLALDGAYTAPSKDGSFSLCPNSEPPPKRQNLTAYLPLPPKKK